MIRHVNVIRMTLNANFSIEPEVEQNHETSFFGGLTLSQTSQDIR